jgi:hypothetical protein
MTSTPQPEDRTLQDLAVQRLCRIFGTEQGRRIFDQTLQVMGRAALQSADDLYAFSQVLVSRGGMEAAVGAMLGVAAVLRGAVDPRRRE